MAISSSFREKLIWLPIEGALIVFSILLAFKIDTWWDELQDRCEEEEILDALYIEFETNRDKAASVISINERDIQSVSILMELKEGEILALPAEAVEEMIGSFADPRTFEPVRGTVDALISAGKLGILRDRELREALTTFINVVDDTIEDANYLGQSSIVVWNELAINGGPWRNKVGSLTVEDCAVPRPHVHCYVNDVLVYLPAATARDLLRLRNNTVLMGYVNNHKVVAAHYTAEIRRVVIQIESVLRLLGKNI